MLLQPGGSGLKKGLGHFVPLDALEKAKEPNVILMKSVMVVIDDGCDAPYRLSLLVGQKKGDVGMLEEGVFLGVDEGLPFH
jgi:hypothetical protein